MVVVVVVMVVVMVVTVVTVVAFCILESSAFALCVESEIIILLRTTR